MICTICGSKFAKEYRHKQEGREIVLTLCESCYADLYSGQESEDFFASFVGRTGGKQSRACPVCGLTLADFRRTGLLGCADCYSAFRRELLPTIRYVQGKLRHEGKAPSGEADERYDLVRDLVRAQETLRVRIDEAEKGGDEAELARLKAELGRVNKKLYGEEDV